MRMFAIAMMAACLTGAAAYAEPEAPKSFHEDCEASSRVDSEEIARIVAEAMAHAEQTIAVSGLDEATAAEIEARVQAALARVDAQMAADDGHARYAALSEAEAQAIEARVEAAMARVEAAMEAREAQEAAIEARVEAAMERAEAAMERAAEEAERAREDPRTRQRTDKGFELGGGGLAGGPRM